MAILVTDVNKRFGDFVALDDVNLDVKSGSLTTLLGPSGSGKSTLLRVIAGLETPDTGTVVINGEDATTYPPQKRGVGFVFQHYAAFKHMTVRDNVAFGLSIRKRPKKEIAERVRELLSLVQLDGLADRYPSQLSGGQRQRMALARALAVEPKVLLLDEPFGALDARVRKELRAWLRRLHEEVHQTTILVTHDQEEAMEVSDTIVVMDQGAIQQVGSARDLYERPVNQFVMSFIGPVNRVGDIYVRPARHRAEAGRQRHHLAGHGRAAHLPRLRGPRGARARGRRAALRPDHPRRRRRPGPRGGWGDLPQPQERALLRQRRSRRRHLAACDPVASEGRRGRMAQTWVGAPVEERSSCVGATLSRWSAPSSDTA